MGQQGEPDHAVFVSLTLLTHFCFRQSNTSQWLRGFDGPVEKQELTTPMHPVQMRGTRGQQELAYNPILALAKLKKREHRKKHRTKRTKPFSDAVEKNASKRMEPPFANSTVDSGVDTGATIYLKRAISHRQLWEEAKTRISTATPEPVEPAPESARSGAGFGHGVFSLSSKHKPRPKPMLGWGAGAQVPSNISAPQSKVKAGNVFAQELSASLSKMRPVSAGSTAAKLDNLRRRIQTRSGK